MTKQPQIGQELNLGDPIASPHLAKNSFQKC